MINAINAARQVRTRHRGNRVFSKGVLRRNGGKFPEGGTQEAEEQPRQSCAKEPQAVWQRWRKVSSLVVNRGGDETRELFPCQMPT